ncbi:MAG: BTAD domain-containing putative transcriptional regulator, partial [Chloroflexota bacterium]|nr:BTAD domain-containing putative transcriptional regulator [Chloroflexota bacterium]
NVAGNLDQTSYIVLDECDRALEDEFALFVHALMARLPAIRIVLFTRTLPRRLITELSHQVVCLPSNPSLMLWDYAKVRSEQMALLEVRAFGLGRVLLNGKPIDNWDGALPRLLFFYLIDRGMVTRGEIFETFWPNLSVREATNVFHVTKRKISEVLGIDVTKYGSGYYHIASSIHLIYDVALFTEGMQESEISEGQDAVVLMESALMLYRGDFLTSMNTEWVTRRRNDLQHNYAEALLSLADTMEQMGDAPRALGTYRRAVAAHIAAATTPLSSALTAKIAALERALRI